eukprot:30542_1
MSQTKQSKGKGKKKRKGLFYFTGKSNKKDTPKKDTRSKPMPMTMMEDDPDSSDEIATKPHLKHPPDDTKMPGNNATNIPMTDIDLLVDKMKSILTKLGALNHESHHSVDNERFVKLVEWVNYSESHFALLEEAWNDSSFWPFLSTQEAAAHVRKDKTMLIRLSNTIPGVITVTRLAQMMKDNRLEEYVKHKRYFASDQFGRLTLTGSWGERAVTWHGLLSYLQQKECCICLEELTENNAHSNTQNMVLRLNCGHHFHRHCIERHVQHSKQMNGTAFAVCPLCRKRIQNAELIKEPSFRVYKPIPDMAKSRSCDVPNTHLNHNGGDTIQRAHTAEHLPMRNGDDQLMLQMNGMMQQGNNDMNNHPWNAFGNHLGVSNPVSKHVDDDDDYASAAQVRRQVRMNTNANQ